MTVRIETAFSWHRQGKFAQAASLYRVALIEDPSLADALHLLGAVAVQLELPAIGAVWLLRACRMAPSNSTYLGNLARACELAGAGDAAERLFRQTLSLDAKSVSALEGLARCLWRAGRQVEAGGLSRQALALGPDRDQAHALGAHIALALFALREAAIAVQRALAINCDALRGADHTLHAFAGFTGDELCRIGKQTLVRMVLDLGMRRRSSDPYSAWIAASIAASLQFAGWAGDVDVEADRLLLLQRSIAAFDGLSIQASAVEPKHAAGNEIRIAFVVGKLAELRHAPTRFVLNWVKWLSGGMGCDCGVFVAHDAVARRYHDVHRTFVATARARFWYADMAGLPMQRDLRTLAEIDSFSPSLVVCWSDELPFEEVLYRRYPTVQFSQMMCMPLPSADVIITLFDPGRLARRWKEQNLPVPEPSGIYRLRAVPVDRPPVQRRRKPGEIALAADDHVIVSVSNRLSLELTEPFVDMMFGHLAANPQSRWLCVGATAFPAARHNSSPLSGRCRFIAYDPDLRGLLTACHVYANPPQRGGGLSVLWAMLEALPVLTLDMPADGAGYVPDRYRIGTLSAYRESLDRLSRDRTLREAWGADMRDAALALTEPSSVIDDMRQVHSVATGRFRSRAAEAEDARRK